MGGGGLLGWIVRNCVDRSGPPLPEHHDRCEGMSFGFGLALRNGWAPFDHADRPRVERSRAVASHWSMQCYTHWKIVRAIAFRRFQAWLQIGSLLVGASCVGLFRVKPNQSCSHFTTNVECRTPSPHPLKFTFFPVLLTNLGTQAID